MSRFSAIALALGLWAAPASAQKVQLQPPRMAVQQQLCSPEQRARCEGVGHERALDRDLSCDACGEVERPMPAEIMAPSSRQPLECSMREMPLGPNPPGCTAPPIDTVPRP